MPTSSGNPTIEALRAEAGIDVAPPSAALIDDALAMFNDLLEEPNANAAKIGMLADINAVSIGQLKNGKMKNISEAMHGKLKALYDGVKAGEILFMETKRGRKAGTAVQANPRKQVTGTRKVGTGKTRRSRLISPSSLLADLKPVTKEFIAQKQAELETLKVEVEYLKEMKKLQDRFKGILF